MRLINLFILASLLAFTSCDSDDVLPPSPITSTENPIDFGNLEAGQTSYYLGAEGECGQDMDWSGDTLILETIELSNGLFFSESYTSGSQRADYPTYIYPVIDNGDYLLLTERGNSALFFFYGNDTLWTSPSYDTNLLQNGCEIYHQGDSLFVGDEIGIIDTYDLVDITIEDKTVVSCVPFFDITGYLLYEPTHLEISYAMFPGPLDGPSRQAWYRLP